MTTRGFTFNGADLGTMTGVIVNRLDLFAPGVRRGGHDVIPGMDGQLGAELPLDAYTFNAAITVIGSTEWEMLANLSTVTDLLMGTNGLGDMYRRIPTGASTYRVDSAKGAFNAGASFALLDPTTGQTELQFTNLSGAWYDGVGGRWRW